MRSCQCYRTFEGAIPKAPLCPIKAHTPLELVRINFTSVESMIKNLFVITDHFMRYMLAVVTRDQTAKTITKVLYERFIAVFGTPTKLLSDHGANFTSALVEELCAMFGIQKCCMTAYHMLCNG